MQRYNLLANDCYFQMMSISSFIIEINIIIRHIPHDFGS